MVDQSPPRPCPLCGQPVSYRGRTVVHCTNICCPNFVEEVDVADLPLPAPAELEVDRIEQHVQTLTFLAGTSSNMELALTGTLVGICAVASLLQIELPDVGDLGEFCPSAKGKALPVTLKDRTEVHNLLRVVLRRIVEREKERDNGGARGTEGPGAV